MKILFLLPAVWLIFSFGSAQNVQLHYDMLKARNGIDRNPGSFTSTIELFRLDPYGSTFFFTDMDYNGYRGVSRAYLEIARNITIKNLPLQLRVEYNGGLLLTDTLKGNSITNAWLFGANLPLKFKKLTAGTYLVYKYIPGNRNGPDFQWTFNWNLPVKGDRIVFNGFFDIWTTDKGAAKKFVILTEPQAWYRVWHQVFLGSEVEISSNFYNWMEGFRAFPTVAVKVAFK